MAGPTGEEDPPLFVGALRIRGVVQVWAGTNESEFAAGGAPGAQSWADTLAIDFRSGANDPNIDEGRYLSFHNEDALPTVGDIRSSAGLEIEAVGDVLIHTPFNIVLGGHSGAADSVQLNADFFRVTTGATERLEIQSDGTWEVGGAGGTSGQYLRSLGVGSPPSWQTITFSEITGGTWADVLARGNNSGAFNPHIDDGQFLGFGVEGSLPGSGDIRSSDAFTINVTGAAALVGSTTASITGGGSNGFAASAAAVILGAGTSGITINNNSLLRISTGGTERLEIEATGAWQLGGLVGTAGQYMRSGGAGASPAWATVTFAEVSGGTWADVLAKGAASGTSNPSINSGQKIIFAGGGTAGGDIDAAGVFVIDAVTSVGITTAGVSRLVIEADGSWNIGGSNGTAGQYARSFGSAAPPQWATIAVADVSGIVATTGAVTIPAGGGASLFGASASGAGLTGGGTAVLAVGQGTHITVNADDVAVNLATLVPAIDSASVVANGTVLERAAITGAVALAQNANTSLFSGILDNGAATTDRQSLNFIGFTIADDPGNNRIDITAPSGSSAWTEVENTTAAADLDDLAGINPNTILMLSGANVRLTGVGAGAFVDGSLLVTQCQGGPADILRDTGGESTATNRFRISGLTTQSLRLADDEAALWMYADMGATATDTPRFMCLSHRAPFCNTSANVHGHQLQHDGTDWVAQAFSQYGTATGLPASGDIRKGTAAALVVSAAAGVGVTSSAGNVVLTAGAVTPADLNATSSADVNVTASDALALGGGNEGVLVCTTAPLTGQGSIRIVEGSAAKTNAAGQGQVWVENTAPNRLIFTHDNNTDLPLNVHCVARNTAQVTVTNSTAVTTIISYTRPANTDRVGTTYRIRAMVSYTKTAITTTSPSFRIAAGGTTLLTVATVAGNWTAAAGTFHMLVEAQITVRTLGAASVCTHADYIHVTGESQAVPVLWSNDAVSVATLSTTVSQSIDLRFFMALNVAGNTLTCECATIERLD
jgi:hypothetical protein